MNLEELEKKIESLEEKVRTSEDIEQIKMLQRAYGYYVDNMMYDDVADLFTDDCTLEIGPSVVMGKENVRNLFKRGMYKKPQEGKRLYVHMQLQGVVHIDHGGQAAKGRWQMIEFATDYVGKPPGELQSIIAHGVYENEYAKENGNWKIKRLIYNSSFLATLQDGWAKKPILERTYTPSVDVIKRDYGDRSWRSGYKVPCHFKNPVTGK